VSGPPTVVDIFVFGSSRAIPKAVHSVHSEDEVRFDDNLITGTEEIEETGLLLFTSRQCDQMAEAIRRALQLGRHSYELEKAHGDALDILLQIMDGCWQMARVGLSTLIIQSW
jgi:hypothetical protein